MSRDRAPDALLFDLDGTLVDTVPARIEAWLAVLTEAGIATSRDALRPMIGMDGRRLAVEAAAVAGRRLGDEEADALDRASGARFDALNRQPRPLPGAQDLLARLNDANVTWAVATSSRAEQVTASVRALGLRHAPRIVDGSHVEHAKPAPDLLLRGAHELGVVPEATWYVGDATWDMRAARAAGMRAIGILAGAAVGERDLRDAGADVVLPTLRELDLDRRR